MDMAMAVSYIETQFNENSNDQTIDIGSLVLEWQGFENPLGLSADNVIISNDRGPFMFVPEIDLNISLRSLLIGQLRFEAIWIREVTLSITKAEDGTIQITGFNQNSETAEDRAVAAILTLKNLIYDLPKVDVLWIDKARMVYRDVAKGTTQRFDPVTFFAEMSTINDVRNLSGFLTFPFGHDTQTNVVKVNFSTKNDPFTLSLNGTLKETPMDNIVQFLPDLPKGVDLNMVVNADIQGRLDNKWQVEEMDLNVSAPRGQILFPLNDHEEFVDVEDFNLHLIQDTKNFTTAIESLTAKINETTDISLSGSFKNIDLPEQLSGNMKLSIQNMPQNYLSRYWPIEHSDNGAYEWLVEKSSAGTFNSLDAVAVFDLSQETRDDGSPLPPELTSASVDFTFQDMAIDYKSPLPSATNVSGSGKLEDIALTMTVETADIGGMKTTDATLFFDDLITKGSGLGTLTFPITAQVQDVFDYIAAQPIGAFDKIDFKPVNTKGDVEATIKVEIPLLAKVPIEDIKVTVNGTVTNAEIPDAVEGLTLSGGPFEVFATTQEIKVNGTGELQGKPITVEEWHEYFTTQGAKDANSDYSSKVIANVTANDAIRRAFTDDFANYFRGDTASKVTYTKSLGGNADIDLDLDLTETAIIVSELGIDKKFGQRVTATLDLDLQNEALTAVNDLKISGRALSLGNGNIKFRNVGSEPVITQASLQNMAFNENRMSVIMKEEGGTLKTNVTGAFFDARPVLGKEKDEQIQAQISPSSIKRPEEYGITVAQMRTSDDATLKNVVAYMRLRRDENLEQFEMDADLGANGKKGTLNVRYLPETEDGLTLRIESNNAGETLRALDLYPYIQGGELQVAGVPLAGGRFGDVRGKARINNFSVAEAPVLLRLINALSFQNFMQAGALAFTRLEADFEWKQKAEGDLYTISNGTTSGTSVALTFDGFVDTAEKNMEITGTAAPLSEINNFIGKIPLIGQLLTGGDALLAATYSIRGDPDDPSVGVNPLSILTPGIVRKLLFENNPKSDTQDRPKTPQKERRQLN